MSPPRLILNMTVGAFIAFLILLVALVGAEAYNLQRISDTQAGDKQRACAHLAAQRQGWTYLATFATPAQRAQADEVVAHLNHLLTDPTCPRR